MNHEVLSHRDEGPGHCFDKLSSSVPTSLPSDARWHKITKYDLFLNHAQVEAKCCSEALRSRKVRIRCDASISLCLLLLYLVLLDVHFHGRKENRARFQP